MPVIPAWVDQVAKVSFEPEKQLLGEIENWAESEGWVVSDGSHLPYELSVRTDVVLEKPSEDRRVPIGILRKSPGGGGEIRMDSSDFVTIELLYDPRERRWSAEVGNIILKEDIGPPDISWVFGKLFRR